MTGRVEGRILGALDRGGAAVALGLEHLGHVLVQPGIVGGQRDRPSERALGPLEQTSALRRPALRRREEGAHEDVHQGERKEDHIQRGADDFADHAGLTDNPARGNVDE